MYQNKVTLIGFLGSNAEARTNSPDFSVTTLSLATKSSYKKDGKYISHTEWHRCVVFGKLSEFAKTLTKGAAFGFAISLMTSASVALADCFLTFVFPTYP
jgi:single-strand DNA-binding protein